MRFTPCLAALLALALAAGAARAAPLTVAVSRSPHSLPVFVAASEGFFEAEGLAVKVVDASSGRRCLKLMAEGQAELGTAAETAIVFESFERTDFSVVATFSSAAAAVELIVRRASGIKRPADLATRRVGVAKGTSAQYFLDNFLLNNDIDPQTVTRVEIEPETVQEDLAAGRVDAVAVFQPFAHAAAHNPRLDTFVMSASADYKQTFNLVAQNSVLKSRRPDVERFLKALHRANQFIRAQPRRAEAIFVSRLGVDPAFAAWSMQHTYAVLALDEALLRTLQSQVRWALREGYVAGRKPADVRALIDPAPLRAVLPNAVGLPQ